MRLPAPTLGRGEPIRANAGHIGGKHPEEFLSARRISQSTGNPTCVGRDIPMKTAWRNLYLLCVVLLVACTPGKQPVPAKKTFAQKKYSTAEEAVIALGTAYARNDTKGIAEILGDKGYRLISSGDQVMDRHEADGFRALYEEGHE